MRTILRAELAKPLMVISAALLLGSCSSPSAPSEPVVYHLLSIGGRPLPTLFDATGVLENGSSVVYDLYQLSGTMTLYPNGTWRQMNRVVRRREAVVIEDLGEVGLWGTFEWRGNELTARRTGPPTPPGAGEIFCCTYVFEASENRSALHGFQTAELWVFSAETIP